MRNRLATGDRVLCWNVGAQSACTFCHDPLETRDHLFFGCRVTEKIWSDLTFNLLKSNYTNVWNDIINLTINDSQGSITLFIIRYVFQTTVYAVWRERNGRRNGEPPTPISSLILNIDRHVRNRLATLWGNQRC